MWSMWLNRQLVPDLRAAPLSLGGVGPPPPWGGGGQEPCYYVTAPWLSLVPSSWEAVCDLQMPSWFVFWEGRAKLPKT